jgi:hypothetical protein
MKIVWDYVYVYTCMAKGKKINLHHLKLTRVCLVPPEPETDCITALDDYRDFC